MGGAVKRRPPCTSPWTAEKITILVDNYPKKGKAWCVAALGMTEQQIRYKASHLGLKARGVSDAWHEKQKKHAEKLTGRKRPEQAAVMRMAILEKGLHIHPPETRRRTGEALSAWFSKNGHPRGMAGKKHTEAAKKKMSKSGSARHAAETSETKSERSMKMLKTKAEKGNLVNPRPQASWKAGWRDVGGQRCYFRSAWEANYARYLQFLLEHRQIAKWEHEPETFWFEAIKRGCRSYLPDFRVTELCGKVVYHEVKGWMDDRSKTKIRRMAKYHPHIKLLVIESKAYKSIARTASVLVEGWE